MTGYLLDTNHASALWTNHPGLVARIAALSDAELSLCLPTIGELWFMVHNSTKVAANEASLRQFLPRFRQYPFDHAAAQEFGRIKTELRAAGRPIPSVDVQIAAVARTNNLIVLTGDAHFAAVPNLKFENWL
jgi:tRNA(fMet)-specific endonuclease VapC